MRLTFEKYLFLKERQRKQEEERPAKKNDIEWYKCMEDNKGVCIEKKPEESV